jgi:hypothetical protein
LRAANDDAFGENSIRLDILFVTSNITDVRIGKAHNLTRVTWVCEYLLIPIHRCVKNRLSLNWAILATKSAETCAFEDSAIGQRDITRFAASFSY